MTTAPKPGAGKLRLAAVTAARDARKLWHDLARHGYGIQAGYARDLMRANLRNARAYRVRP